MWGRSLAVLMWKHLMVRKRRFIHTTVELLSTFIFFFMLFTFRHSLKPQTPSSLRSNNFTTTVKMTEERSLNDDNIVPRPRFLLYTPDTKLAGAIMDEVGLQFGLKRLNALPNKTTGLNYKGYYAYSNASEITEFVKNIYTNEAIIIFEDMEGNDWSDRKSNKLSYTIRTRNRFNTYTYLAPDDVPRDHNAYGYVYDEFMRIQYAIDMSYIKVYTGKTVDQVMTLQEFPYTDSERIVAVKMTSIICNLLGWMSLYIVFVGLMTRLLQERTSGIQELIKMVGVSSNTIGLSHFLNVLPAGLMYAVIGAVLVKVGDNALVENTNGLIIFIALMLNFIAVMSMAILCSFLARSTQYAISISVFCYVVLWLPSDLVMNYPPPQSMVFLTGFLPFVPMAWHWNEIAHFEQYNNGLSFSDMGESHTSTTESVLLGFAFMVVQSAVFFALAWYLSHVYPGKYGQGKPWDFLCQKQYWTKNEISPDSESSEEEPIVRDKKFFEDPPKDMEVGIRIDNVSKVFPKHKALSNVSLDVYKGEITILLGHNGAGKTTLMSIITGMMSASDGKVYVNGMDTMKQQDKVRNQLGLCPQHNLFFSDLTVIEHAMFFALLKGGSYKEARNSSLDLLIRLGIAGKANSQSAELSGGMKRRLQLACALSGGASVLVLDEPTSGLDVETRRELWDLLLSLRGSRTVLLTTHFMEEADALGDRVAALHLGRLRCHATTMYLKKAIGTGYRLSFTTNGVPRDAAITRVVTSYIPDATLKEKTINSLSYNLPATASSKFPTLFTSLEDKKSELGIETIGVGVSTLEEVFLKLCSDTDTTFTDDEVDTGRIEPTYNKVTGIPLYFRQFVVLFKRQIKYIMSKIMSCLIVQMFVPIVLIFVLTYMFNNDANTGASEPSKELSLGLYKPLLDRKVLYKVDAKGATPRAVNEYYPGVKFIDVKNITESILRTGKQSILEYNKHLLGVELNDTYAKAMYTTIYRHAAPVAVNLLSNLIASQNIPGASGKTITVYNHPLDPNVMLTRSEPHKNAKNVEKCIIWAIFIVFVILATNTNFTALICEERVSGSRHLHIMAGCPASLHWLCTLIFHTVFCAVVQVLPVAIAVLTLEMDSTLNQPDMLFTMLLILELGSMAFFALMYFVSLHFSVRSTGMVLFAIMMVFGLITPSVKAAIGITSSNVNVFLKLFLDLSTYTMPPHSMTVAAGKCAYVARLNALCKLNKEKCPNMPIADSGFDSKKCCADENPRNYFEISDYSPGAEILCLAVQFTVLMIVVVMIEKGILNCLCDRIVNKKLKNKATAPVSDEIVRAEAVYVSKEIALPKNQIEEAKLAMLVNDVHKNYFRLFGKSCYAVQGLSFSVKKGECFGLLGVNGAGKSTTFKMLTAEACASKGDIYANGHYINKDKDQYLRTLGYCPQFFGLDSFQSGNDNLQMMLTLRGLDAEEVKNEVKTWISIVGLEKYSTRPVSGYSGGCARRLGAAAALCSGAPLTLLDEPTAGVDVAARRRVWTALRRSLHQQRSVVITSHSMDEMEALCSRIGIMSGGVLRALGTPAELRARHAQGHAVVIKVKQVAGGDEVDNRGTKTDINSLKSTLDTKFNCTLKDEHKTMLHYHINETMRYSNLFTALENLKAAYPALIEDYSVTETTLEEVFLSFAKENQQGVEPAAATRNGIV